MRVRACSRSFVLAAAWLLPAATVASANLLGIGCERTADCADGAQCEISRSSMGPYGSCVIHPAPGVTVHFNTEFNLAENRTRHKPPKDGRAIFDIDIKGALTDETTAAMQQVMAKYRPRVGPNDLDPWFAVNIDSPGGEIHAAMELGRLFRSNHVAVQLFNTASCGSSCVLTWVGAPSRWGQADTPRFIIHRPFGFADSGESLAGSSHRWKTVQAEIHQYLLDMNIPPSLLDLMNEVPSEDGRLLTPEERTRYLMTVDDPALTEIKDAQEARKRGIDRFEYLARKRRVGNCEARVETGLYPNTPGGSGQAFRDYHACRKLYDQPTG
jgi:hypothetical protein